MSEPEVRLCPATTNASGFEYAGLSHVGRVRSRNEDSICIDADNGWLVLADGMGGYQGGDVASALSVRAVLDRLQRCPDAAGHGVAAMESALCEGLNDANEAILQAGAANAGLSGMGATMVAAWVTGKYLVHAHVGDSRLYRLRPGRLEQLTCDHTVLQAQVDAGLIDPVEAAQMPVRGLLTRGLGVAPTVAVDVGAHELVDQDRFMLCSDGLTDMIDAREIARLLGASGPVSELAQGLVDAALARGGRDNVSVIIARFAG
ncbi:MAG: protein phosphatase 2C domain-containing protein [Azoarcus sp.]|jgi:protein phosphatase|nr:protein phosphatase 2C domain-containing protein [Azoarcus sp.]